MENMIISVLFVTAVLYLVRLFRTQFSIKKACSKTCGCAKELKKT